MVVIQCVEVKNDIFDRKLPYCDEQLSHEQRVDDLLKRLTLEEKVALISPQPSIDPNICADHTGKVDRLGIPTYM